MKLSWKELVAALILLSLAGAFVLPLFSRARDSARRASCQNNLKQLGIVLKMYANESRLGDYPPLSSVPGNWMMEVSAVYPDYLSDLSVFICPSNPLNFPEEFTLRRLERHPGGRIGELHPDCVTGKYYTYTGYVLTGDEPALALYLAYHADPEAVRGMSDLRVPIPRWEQSDWGPNRGGMTVLWDRVPIDQKLLPHMNNIINVLCMDGSVRSVPYSAMNHSENFPVTEMTALTFGLDVPGANPDCY